MIGYVLRNLINNMALLIIIAYLITRVKMFKELLTENKNTLYDKILMAVIFGFIGILATYTGTNVNGAIANSRIIGVLVGGIFGGPIVGVGAGLIAGLHRWAIDIGGFTAFACALSTILEGIIGGLASKYVKNLRSNWIHALVLGIIAELLQMGIILLIAKPYAAALELVRIIFIPMVLFNPVGIALFVGLINGIFREQEKEAAIKTQLALQIAEKCLPFLRNGLASQKDILEVAKTIYKMSGVSAVAITDRHSILAHVGVGEDHHKECTPIMTNLTRESISTGVLQIAHTKHEIGCTHWDCKLKSAVIVPLLNKNDIIGTIKLYKTREHAISNVDVHLALGLAKLFSSQLALSEIEYQIKLREKAELKALQSQINPHFLFNTLNTIVSFCRVKPDKARELLIDLSTHLRNSLQFNDDFVSLDTELNHVNAYLSIEKARFEEKLTIEINREENTDCLLPQLILQPIVENAILHGLLPNKDGGTLRIDIAREKDESATVITVQDTGKGMDQSRIDQLYNGQSCDNKIGLNNVHNRLKSIYGSQYGLEIKSSYGSGTLVRLRIPQGTAGETALC